MLKLIFSALLLIAVQIHAQTEFGRNITKTLCDSSFHGRGYVNGGDSVAAEYLAKEFKNLGVDPIKKCYFQEFSFSVNTFPGKMSCNFQGENLLAGSDFLVDAASAGYNGKLNPKILDSNILLDRDKLIETIKNFSIQSEFNAFLLDYSGISKEKLGELRGLGSELANMLPVIEITPDKFTWSVSQSQSVYPYFLIQESQYDRNKIPVCEVEIEAKLIKKYTSRNVIAYLPAAKKSKKTIVYTAHYDHLGRMGANTYFPGGNDNASGTAMLLTMAQHFKNNPPDFNVLFIAFAGEEAGLLGSKYYTENPLFSLDKMTFLVNLDIMGSGEEGITVVNATLFDKQFKTLQTINEENQLLAQVKSRGPAANSDHYFFTEKGVPAFFIYTMGPNKNYHDIQDTFENLSFNEFADIQKLLIEFAKRL